MPVHVYNSLTRKKEELIPLNPPKVNIYTCGVTVYDESHIGHARSLYVFDVIRRYLKYRGFKVRFVRNITDIDDKIINRAKELGISWKEVTKRFIDSYRKDLKLLGIEKADFEPCATENIKDMIKHIKRLIERGFAYVASGSVYFNVRKFPAYGKLSGQSIEQMLSGVRIEPDEKKQDPLDFALWKKSKPDEPYWRSTWGSGRPGWHIECSTMSMKYLKTETLDIHAGGRDLIFPHHENEIAQSQASTGKPFARYWIHHGLLTTHGQKMAKSLGNFVTIKDFIAKYKDADLLKLFFLSTHYAHPIDYNEDKIKEAGEAHERIFNLIFRIAKKLSNVEPQPQVKRIDDIENIKNKFLSVMDDDFNMPQGLARLFDLVSVTNRNMNNLDFIFNAGNLLYDLSRRIFGLELEEKHDTWEFKNTIEVLIKKRNEAREKRNFVEADRIREELETRGIIIEDTKDGTVWRRKL